MGFYARISLVDPTKVKAQKSFLFTEKLCCIENKEHLFYLLSHIKQICSTLSIFIELLSFDFLNQSFLKIISMIFLSSRTSNT